MNSAKRNLFISIFSLVICIAMLVSTTFAWFTDSVTSGINTIVAGNLDIELEYWNGTDWVPVDSSTLLFDDDARWEPGHTEVAHLQSSKRRHFVSQIQDGRQCCKRIVRDQRIRRGVQAFGLSGFRKGGYG